LGWSTHVPLSGLVISLLLVDKHPKGCVLVWRRSIGLEQQSHSRCAEELNIGESRLEAIVLSWKSFCFERNGVILLLIFLRACIPVAVQGKVGRLAIYN